MKKQAWTMVELSMAIVIIIMLSGFCVTLFKPNIQKAKFFVYAATSNIKKGNIAIIEKHNSIKSDNVDDNDWYCVNFADNLNLDTAADCSTTAGDYDANITFPNGTTIMGLASAWQQPYTDSTFYYKNILIDIDGASSGPNKIWADRFPFRIISGSGKGAEGIVMPVNCANDVVYDTNQKKDVAVSDDAKSVYCPTTGAKNYGLDDQVFTFDIYRSVSSDGETKSRSIASSLSPMQADCNAYGGVNGYYSIEECSNAGFKILSQCANEDNCESYKTESGTKNTFPNGTTTVDTCKAKASEENPDKLSCFAVAHRPTGGISFIIQSLIGDIDNI